MSMRIKLAKFILRLGAFIQSLPPVIMKPDDLIEFSRQGYAKPGNVEGWSEDGLIDSGLSSNELELMNALPNTGGKLLLLGVGGGREAIPFAEMGFKVTGIDYVPAMVERAVQNVDKRGYHIEGLVQEISKLDVPKSAFDVVWISKAMYSCVPTRARRMKMVEQISQALKPGGVLICQFHSGLGCQNDSKTEQLRRIIAVSPLGNRDYENGDILWLNVEFLHIFTSEAELRSELEAGGLMITQVNMNPTSTRGSAVCSKAPQSNT